MALLSIQASVGVGSIVLLVWSLQGCSPARGPERSNHAAPEVVVAEDDAVVARVNGVPVTASRVAALARLTKSPPSEVVERLVVMELLAQEARRRGLESSSEVGENVRKAMVQRYLEKAFEATHRPEDLPEDMLRQAYQKNIGMFVRPRLRKVAHILVEAQDGKATKAEQREAFALAHEIHDVAVKAKSLEEFGAAAERFNGTQGFKVRLEVLNSPVYKGARLAGNFVDAAMLLDKIGQVSEPVETMFGSHVIYLIDVMEPLDRSFEEVREEVLGNEYPFWRKVSFNNMVDEMRLSTVVTGYEGQIRRAENL